MFNSSTTAVSTFQPIPQLRRPDANLVMVFMSKNTGFIQRIDDPWFTATVPRVVSFLQSGGRVQNITTYYPDDPVSVMGCLEQSAWCNVANGKCTSLTGTLSSPATEAALAHLDLNPRQTATLNRLWPALLDVSIYNIIQYLGGTSLLATQYSSPNAAASSSLPSNQWILELAHWFGAAMVKPSLLLILNA